MIKETPNQTALRIIQFLNKIKTTFFSSRKYQWEINDQRYEIFQPDIFEPIQIPHKIDLSNLKFLRN